MAFNFLRVWHSSSNTDHQNTFNSRETTYKIRYRRGSNIVAHFYKRCHQNLMRFSTATAR